MNCNDVLLIIKTKQLIILIQIARQQELKPDSV